MKNRLKILGIPILILVANYLAISPLMSHLTSIYFLKKGIYFTIIVTAIFFSGWIVLGDQTRLFTLLVREFLRESIIILHLL